MNNSKRFMEVCRTIARGSWRFEEQQQEVHGGLNNKGKNFMAVWETSPKAGGLSTNAKSCMMVWVKTASAGGLSINS